MKKIIQALTNIRPHASASCLWGLKFPRKMEGNGQKALKIKLKVRGFHTISILPVKIEDHITSHHIVRSNGPPLISTITYKLLFFFFKKKKAWNFLHKFLLFYFVLKCVFIKRGLLLLFEKNTRLYKIKVNAMETKTNIYFYLMFLS